MIKINDLRIGNFVLSQNDSRICKVFALSDECEDNNGNINGYDCKYIEPILLTEDFFLKFGFEKDIDYEYLQGCFNTDCSFFLNNSNTPFSRVDLINGTWFLRTPENEHYPCPKHVHKFQNWWYESTGIILNIL